MVSVSDLVCIPDKIPSDYLCHQSLCAPSYRTTTNKNKPKVAKSENIGANHLGFTKFLFQQYSQQLGLNSNYYPAESVFNFYVNDKITECLGGTVNIEAVRENFYTELFQHTNLPRNYSFAPIIKEINQTIKRYTQQQFPITYADKGKKRLQTPAVTPKEIQLPTQKKQRIESPPYSSYYHTPGSTINILSASASTPNATSTFGQFSFQSKQKKAKLLELYVNSEVETPNIQTLPTQDNQNPNLINQPNLPPPPQPPNLDPMVYAPIAKLDNFTSEEDDAQVWLNDSLINKPQDFNAFKVEFLRYFSNNNSINHLVNTFTTMKQGETEAVTTYLRHFHRNLCQIQTINANYFTAPQILNQFIYGLCSSILQHVCLLHSDTLQDAVTRTKDFESAESKANYVQAATPHNTDARFNLRYPGKNAIKLEPHLCICLDLKIALEILTTTIVQLASRSSLAKREINIRGGIIDTGYVRNIITILQNDSEKTYIIELNEKIAQAIFLPLIKVAQLVLVKKKKELGITAKGI
ncbi:hypothetical protein G9A89_004196 [Geosiphon pyriformis]|nr:hypothetical protein G9A89_004196 [Geosiphon pyriformis]